jgi:tetratricopeptide (TPR) repeat protein
VIKNTTKYLLILVIAAVSTSWQTPKTAEDYNNRGLDRQNSGDLDGAIADYTKALSLKANPITLATIYNNRANAFMNKNDLAAAIADYGSAINLAPTNFENYYNRGIALYNKGDLDAAFADYSKAIELFPKFAMAFNERGNTRIGKGDADGAIADYSQAIALSMSRTTTTAESHSKTNIKLMPQSQTFPRR